MILAIDIGNTNITFGLFTGSRLVKKGQTPTLAVNRYSRFAQRLKSGFGPTKGAPDGAPEAGVIFSFSIDGEICRRAGFA